MPLTERVSFKARLQRANRLQVPRLVRWQFKLEPTQILTVSVSVVGVWGNRECFLARMSKDGRIVVPGLTLALLKRDKPTLEGYVFDVILEP